MACLQATSEDILTFLRDNNVRPETVALFKIHQFDGLSFCLLTERDLREMGIRTIGERKLLIFLAACWRQAIEYDNSQRGRFSLNLFGDDIGDSACHIRKAVQSTGASSLLVCSTSKCSLACGDEPQSLLDALQSSNSVEPNLQLWKVIVSALYAFIVGGITSFVMVVAHERLPDMSKYPPLPDLLLDNLPHISWAFEAAEWVGVVLMMIWIIILTFHRHRWILLRRFFALMGTVFLLRSITMLITSLSVPGLHLADHCFPYEFANQSSRFKRVWDIWSGFGMSTRGIRTCGDYMFSGHTTCLTLLNFFITEYSPRRFQMLHTLSWVLNLFGVFFILASHEHYSIDVFVAVYVSSRLFLYYHCLANNRILVQEDKNRAMIWFPLFSFLEYDVNGIIPNTYELPFFALFSRLRISRGLFPEKSGDVFYSSIKMPSSKNGMVRSEKFTKVQ